MKMQGTILNEEEKRRIHDDSIRILEEIGVRFPSETALNILEAGGAQIDRERQVAQISREMVDKALSSAPKNIMLGARNQEKNLILPSDLTVYNLDGCGVNTFDYGTGKRRPSVLQDVANAARVFEEVEAGMVYWTPVSPSDVPHHVRGIVGTGTSWMNTSKHIQDEVKFKEEVPYVIEMAKAILGDLESVISRKIYSVTYCTVAPLCHDCDMMEATLELCKYQAPILIYPMPACGTTGPASLYSNLALANAEALSAIVLFQLASPGTPLIFGSALGVVNVRSGMFLEGAPETVLQMTAMGEMGKFYGLPVTTAGCLTDAKIPGMQSVLEKVLTTLPLVLSGSDVVQGIGLIESSMTLSLEHILIDEEIAGLCRRMKDGITVSGELDFYEDIRAVGHGGHFLKQKNTRTSFRSREFFQTQLCDRNSYDGWESLGKQDMIQSAAKKVKTILSGELKNPLPYQTEKVLLEIMDDARRTLAGLHAE